MSHLDRDSSKSCFLTVIHLRFFYKSEPIQKSIDHSHSRCYSLHIVRYRSNHFCFISHTFVVYCSLTKNSEWFYSFFFCAIFALHRITFLKMVKNAFKSILRGYSHSFHHAFDQYFKVGVSVLKRDFLNEWIHFLSGLRSHQE